MRLDKFSFMVIMIIFFSCIVTVREENLCNGMIDQVIIELNINDTRIDVGQVPEVNISGRYMLDNTPFEGNVTINHPADYDTVKMHNYTVLNITDLEYGVKSFTCNKVSCVWDRIMVTAGGASNSTSTPNKTETIWFKTVYEYDDEPFTARDGKIWINEEEASWNEAEDRWEFSVKGEENQTLSFKVIKVEDDKYGLTTLNHEAPTLSIEWKALETVIVPEEIDEDEDEEIPGFPVASIFIGFAVLGLSNNIKEKLRNKSNQ